MVHAHSKTRIEWAAELERVLQAGGIKYIVRIRQPCSHSLLFFFFAQLVKAVQLVGVCLFIFVHPRHINGVRGLEKSICKTGAGGKVVHLSVYFMGLFAISSLDINSKPLPLPLPPLILFLNFDISLGWKQRRRCCTIPTVWHFLVLCMLAPCCWTESRPGA